MANFYIFLFAGRHRKFSICWNLEFEIQIQKGHLLAEKSKNCVSNAYPVPILHRSAA